MQIQHVLIRYVQRTNYASTFTMQLLYHLFIAIIFENRDGDGLLNLLVSMSVFAHLHE